MLNETIAVELVQEGKDLIVREKRKRQRAEDAMARRRDNILGQIARDGTIGGAGNAGGSNGNGTGGGGNGSGGGGGGGAGGILSKYKSRNVNTVGPNDDLVGHGDGRLDYSSTGSGARGLDDINRSLSQEINERFGVSTGVSVGFKGYGTTFEDDDNRMGGAGGRSTSKPKGLFDDV
uniref:Uncharacterized protein n=1 Tax=Anopheles maculatus TaxID=74869 RepID=A0A182SEG4_9DIPT